MGHTFYIVWLVLDVGDTAGDNASDIDTSLVGQYIVAWV